MKRIILLNFTPEGFEMSKKIAKVCLFFALFLTHTMGQAQDSLYKNSKQFRQTTSLLDSMAKANKAFLWDRPSTIRFDNDGIDSNKFYRGQPAPDFILNDTGGKMISLKDFRGKILYIDFWATWCSPCLKEMPMAKSLEDTFREKEVVFIYISIDENEDVWRKHIQEKQMSGTQLISPGGFNSEIAQLYKLKGIPTFVLIDKEGKVAKYDTNSPSSGAKEEITKLLN